LSGAERDTGEVLCTIGEKATDVGTFGGIGMLPGFVNLLSRSFEKNNLGIRFSKFRQPFQPTYNFKTNLVKYNHRRVFWTQISYNNRVWVLSEVA
jgi:hypothetical protein